MKLKIDSIVESISGEIGRFPQGAWCTIVRFAGCNLRCPYCDTKGTWEDTNAKDMYPQEVVNLIKTRNVLITGGEPMVQTEGLEELLRILISTGKFVVQIETNGSLPLTSKMLLLSKMYPSVLWVVDWKGPSSEQEELVGSFESFVARYGQLCQDGLAIIKMVVANHSDLEEMRKFRLLFEKAPDATVAFSPVGGGCYWVPFITNICQQEFLFELSNGQIILSIQIHKWIDMP